MSLIHLNDLSVTLGAPLFSGLNLTLHHGDRLGLVAANGRGKTTLLSLLAGTTEPTSGDITSARGLRVGLLPQHVPAAVAAATVREAVLAALPPDTADYEAWRADVAMDELGLPAALHDRPLSELSGGWQRLAMLARVWVTEPDLLLLDEPTNHLDLARIGFLQRWLAGLPRDIAVVVTSHDRAFLDTVTGRTLFLRPERSRDFALPFSTARVALEEADAAEDRRYANDMRKVAQLRRQAAKLKNIGINSGSDLLTVKTRQLSERAARLEDSARPAHQERSAGAIQLANSGTHAKALVTLSPTEVTTPEGRLLYRTGPLWIERGDRVVLLGANGAGKTRLVNRLVNAIGGDDPDIRVAGSVVPGISDQALGQLDQDPTPLDAITGRFTLGDQRARAVLAGAGIGIDLQQTALTRLSGGQKARLAMLVLRLTEPNFYLLDEPTNHLDIEGQEALETELLERQATCLIVSHDRSFVRNTGTRFWQIVGRRLVEVDDPEPFFAESLTQEG